MEPHSISGHTFTLNSKRYDLSDAKIRGKGRFGVVTTAIDQLQHKRKIAIKRIRPFAHDDWDARHTLREVRVMQILAAHPNIITIYDLSLNEAKSELYMMMELMDCDLHQIIQSKQPLTEKHHKCFIKQILEGVNAMHEVGIFHVDLKPANLLVSGDCRLRIADFGDACYMREASINLKNEYIRASTDKLLWYHSPELLLSPFIRSLEAIDLWSIGCILAELFRREPLFPGDNRDHQAILIFEVLGYVSDQHLGFEVRAKEGAFLEHHCLSCGMHIDSVVPDASPSAVDLIAALLSIDPIARPTAAQALSFGFLNDASTLCEYNRNYLSHPADELFALSRNVHSR